MKKKNLMIGIAIALVVALVVGGTLMLFSAQTGTAKNKIKLGTEEVVLWEEIGIVKRGGTPYILDAGVTRDFPIDEDGTTTDFNDEVYKNINAAGFTQFPKPGDEILKKPYVENKSDNPVYVYVDVIFKIYEPYPVESFPEYMIPVDLNEVTKDMEGLEKEAFIADIFRLIQSVDPGWIGDGAEIDDDGNLVGRFYYATGGDTGYTLTPVPGGGKLLGGATSPIFTFVELPLDLGDAGAGGLTLINGGQGLALELNLTGYAIQTDSVDGGPHPFIRISLLGNSLEGVFDQTNS